jgi:hypothetical protein
MKNLRIKEIEFLSSVSQGGVGAYVCVCVCVCVYDVYILE